MLHSIYYILGLIKAFQNLNSQAPDLPCAAVGHVFRLSRPLFGCYLKTVIKYLLEIKFPIK